MSRREIDRLAVIRRVVERRLSQKKAGELIGLSTRQVRRLCRAYGRCGPIGLASGKRGMPSNRGLPEELRKRAMAIVRERIVVSSAVLPWPKRIRSKMSDKRHCLNHRDLHVNQPRTIPNTQGACPPHATPLQ